MELSSYEESRRRFISWTLKEAVHIERIRFFLSLSTFVPKTSSWYKLGSSYVELGKTDGMGFCCAIWLHDAERCPLSGTNTRLHIYGEKIAGSHLGQGDLVCEFDPQAAGVMPSCRQAGCPSASGQEPFCSSPSTISLSGRIFLLPGPALDFS